MKKGDRVSWRSLNRRYSGEVTGFYKTFAVVRIDGSGKSVLLFNNSITSREPNRTAGHVEAMENQILI